MNQIFVANPELSLQ